MTARPTAAVDLLRAYVLGLAEDRGITPAAVLEELRIGQYADPAAVTVGTQELAASWLVTVSDVERLAAELAVEGGGPR